MDKTTKYDQWPLIVNPRYFVWLHMTQQYIILFLQNGLKSKISRKNNLNVKN